MLSGDFKWCDPNIIETTVPDDLETSYILEMDLEYPKKLHDPHHYLPLVPKHRTPSGLKES